MRDRTTPSGLRGVVSALVVGATLAGCWPSPITVPPGAQEVHVHVTGDEVRLEPTTVQAGEVYLVLDDPGTDVTMVQRMSGPDATPGPLGDEQLDRIAHGDTSLTAITGGFANGEPYGNVSRLHLVAGAYVFLAASPESLAERSGGVIPPESLAVLQVLP